VERVRYVAVFRDDLYRSGGELVDIRLPSECPGTVPDQDLPFGG
jgi:hypothetical protein